MILLSRIIKSKLASIENHQTIKIREFTTSLVDTGVTEVPYIEHLVKQQLDEASQEAEMIIEKARREAKILTQQTENAQIEWEKTEKPKLIQRAFDEGYNEGTKQGQQQGYDEAAEMIALAQQTITLAKEDYHKHLEASEGTILDLAIAVSGKIIGMKLQDSEETFMTIVKRAIKEARHFKDVQLHIHPVHYENLMAQKEELKAIFPKEIEFYIYPDPDLTEGSCVIESENGRIDASVDSQLEVIKGKLSGILEGEKE
jgi:flagellar assembly protein FliH